MTESKITKNNDIEMRKVYSEMLCDLVEKGYDVVACGTDTLKDMGLEKFKEEHSDRVFQGGTAAQTLFAGAAGMSLTGRIPFAHSHAAWASKMALDHIYVSGGYAESNVKIVATEPGVQNEGCAGSELALEDVAIMRCIPGMTVVEPTDPVMLKWVMKEAADIYGMFYIRFDKKSTKSFYKEDDKFELGKANVLREGGDVTIIASGSMMVSNALEAAEKLEAEGIDARVVDMFCIKPFDTECLMDSIKKTGAIVTAENQTLVGGLASAVADSMAEENTYAPLEKVGIASSTNEYGDAEYLEKYFKLTVQDIVDAAKKVLEKKSRLNGGK